MCGAQAGGCGSGGIDEEDGVGKSGVAADDDSRASVLVCLPVIL